MANEIAERLVWAVETLVVDPADHLLEIGCGHGVVVSLVCEQLGEGTITAIDRSAKMIAMAQKRNRACVASGRAVFQSNALSEADFGQRRFDKIFAVNVSLFRTQAAAELAIIRRHLTPGGALYLFHQDPWIPRTPSVTDTLTEILANNGFTIERILRREMAPLPVNCITAKAT
ncbi:MAG: class I SAM-dependent methyltransferase [Chloroflexia bacterium]|nr:class I SAM-dependent methyltransferase [Chloroflexia bacterium]